MDDTTLAGFGLTPAPDIELPTVEWKTFLQTFQPHREATAGSVYDRSWRSEDRTMVWQLETPELQLYCPSPDCGGERNFSAHDPRPPLPKRIQSPLKTIANIVQSKFDQPVEVFLTYTCRNCRKHSKTYALRIQLRYDPGDVYKAFDEDEPTRKAKAALVSKIGEWPALSLRMPSRALSLVGPDQDLFRKGQQCESQGFGLGAFAYYRRVVERQKARLIGDILKAANVLKADAEVISRLEAAQNSWEFSQSIDKVRVALPAGLLVEGENPLTLLHRALSDALHDRDESHCLGLAESIRLVLTQLAENVSATLADRRELRDAVSRLTQATQPKQKSDAG
jgi:hypothetical protein